MNVSLNNQDLHFAEMRGSSLFRLLEINESNQSISLGSKEVKRSHVHRKRPTPKDQSQDFKSDRFKLDLSFFLLLSVNSKFRECRSFY